MTYTPSLASFITALFGIMCLVFMSSCSQRTKTPEAYVKEIDHWHKQRIESLKERDSWLSLAGLYWLEEGKNTFGSNTENDLVFPKDKAPGRLGWFTFRDDEVRVHINPEVNVLADGKPVTDTILTDSTTRKEPVVLQYGSLHWHVIKRGDLTGIRLKDSKHPALASFKGMNRFPVSAEWRVEARYVEFKEPRTISVPNVLGQVVEESLYGTLKFDISGETYTLDPLGGPESDSFFIIFGDKTNGDETYGGGRFVYVGKPDKNSITYIDFNKACNPPCVFNKFATCPLPPAQNKLSVEITTGEKVYKTSVQGIG